MKQQQAFAGSEKMLKGGLHCHTTRSDGAVAPDEVIRLHYENGYDFLALTDHRFYNYTNFAPEVPLTIIPGMEMDRNIEDDRPIHTFHSVWLGREKPNNPYEQDQVFERELERNTLAFKGCNPFQLLEFGY